ncbi:glycosyltransferase family 9 protein [Chitinispirillales bacterium ANBcel5]|uniref:glycosyltransferase family 9 protein n=1 Tax=Cellulosispirillum alkaliphilum TaxID=3039283 RepID=UPI002A56F647|nr:glycosyltransferase family 9 protein [Chitinispirillales bacterium ANBcel5]
MCEKKASTLLSSLKVSNILSYEEDQKQLFTQQWKSLCQQIKRKFDLCIVLDKTPELCQLYLAAKSGATARIGFGDGYNAPFLNIQLKNQSETANIFEQNRALTQLLGNTRQKIKWSVAKSTLKDIEHLLKQHSISQNSPLLGIDLPYLLSTFDKGWIMELIKCIKKDCRFSLFAFDALCAEQQTPSWISELNLKVIPQLSLPRAAALISLSDTIITGKSTLFAISTMLSAKNIAIFEKKDAKYYENSKTYIISYNNTPDRNTIEQVMKFLIKSDYKSQKKNNATTVK